MRIDLGISLIGGPNAKDQRYIHITRPDVVKRIKNHPAIDPWTKDYLITKVNQYPDNALIYFVQNINEMVVTALNERTRILKEQYDNEQKERRASEIGGQSIEHEGGRAGGSGVVEAAQAAATTAQEEDPERDSLFKRAAG